MQAAELREREAESEIIRQSLEAAEVPPHRLFFRNVSSTVLYFFIIFMYPT